MQVARPLPSFSRPPQPCLEAPPLASCPPPPSLRPLATNALTACISSTQAGATPRPSFHILQYPYGDAATTSAFPGSVRVCCTNGPVDLSTRGGDSAGGGGDGGGGGGGDGSSTRSFRRTRIVRSHWGPCEVTSSESETDGDGDVLYGGAGGRLSPADIISLAEEYVDAWWRGVARGTEAAAESLARLVAVKPAVGEDPEGAGELVLVPDGVLHRRPLKGYEALLSQLAEQHTEYHRVHYRPVSRAASSVSSCGYVLGEYRMQDVGGLAGHPATFRVSRGFCLFKLRVDPRSGRITRGWVRRQLTQEERDERVWDPVHVYPAPFPLERLHLTREGRPGPSVMEEAACTWVAAQAKHMTHHVPPPPPLSAAASSAASKEMDANVAMPRAASAAKNAEEDRSSGAKGAPATTTNGVAESTTKAEGTVVSEEEEEGNVVGAMPAAATTTACDALPTADSATEPPLLPVREGAAAAAGGGGCSDAGGCVGGGLGGIDSISTSGLISSTTASEITSGGGGGGGGGGSGIGAPGNPEIGRLEHPGASGGGSSGNKVAAAAAESAHPVRPREAAVTTKAQRRLVDTVLAPDCRLLDAYGMWPDPGDEEGPYPGTYGGQRPQAVVGAARVLQRIQAHQRRCERVEPMLFDVAVSEDHNVVFVHWVNVITPAQQPVVPRPPAPVRQQQQQQDPASPTSTATSLTTDPGQTRREGSGGGGGGRSTSAAVAASTAATAAATAASAAAQAATAAADVATTAASAASVAATTANTAATIAATAATAAAFVAGDVTVRPPNAAAAAAASAGSHSRHVEPAEAPLPQQVEGGGRSLAVVTSGMTGFSAAGSEKAGEVAAASAGMSGKPPAFGGASDVDVTGTTSAGGGAGGARMMGLQDLRIPMPPIPPMPQMPQFQSQIQNLEEVLTAAAQRVAGAAGTAAAAASAAAAAASAVIKAEAAASGGGAAAAAAITNGASGKEIAAAVAAKATAARKATPPPVVPYHQECMAALLINDDGTVSDVWLFRGPYHHEKRLLRP